MAKNNAKLPNVDVLVAAGIDPKTGLPVKVASGTKGNLKNDIKKALRIIDEQDAVNRYTWYNLPCNITGQELERMLYYKGQLAFFYMDALDEFYFMPYALDGTIDFYGRFNSIHPVPMTSGTTDDDKATKAQADVLSMIKLKCVYGMKLPDEVDADTLTKSAVILHDYTKQLSQNIVPRQIINDPIIDVMSELPCFMRTNFIASSGIKGVRVNDADQAASVVEGSGSLEQAALTGDPWVPMVGNIEFQELTDGQVTKSEEYLMSMQSLDNLRLSTYGLENGGLFEKKAHILNSENAVNQSNVGLVFQDGLSIRQNFCNIVNSIWGLGIWCEPTENETMADVNGDGKLYDDNADGGKSGVAKDTNKGGNEDVSE